MSLADKFKAIEETEQRIEEAATATNGRLHRLGSNVYSLFAKNPVLTLVAVVALVFLIIFGPAFLLGIKQAFSSAVIEKQKTQAQENVNAATQERTGAAQLNAERQAEDHNREQNIEPLRKEAADRLAAARRNREQLESNYEKNLQTPRRPPVDDLDLRRRNCADLAALFPDYRVAGCH